jgi:serine/threonine-protein kinase
VLAAAVAALAVGGAVVALRLFGPGEEKQKAGAVSPTVTPTPPSKVLPAAIDTPAGQMLLVPEGEFLYGPGRERATLPAFYVDRTEVTNAAYQQFCQATGRALPVGFRSNQPELPVTAVTLEDARAFARWAGKRLPNAKEWEKAARGANGRVFPWGDEPDPARANVADHPKLRGKSLVPAAGMPESASPHGALHMTGNAWELVDESQTPSILAIESFSKVLKPPPTGDELWCLIRGAAHTRPLKEGVLYEYASIPARFTSPEIGFRCVKDP